MTTQTISIRIVVRRDTAANWATVNPVLLDGEWGFERDTRKIKLGDGATAWNGLAYYSTGSGSGNAILSGVGAPSAGTGVNGDFYLDTAASRIYGPKTAGAWGSGASLIGAPGAAATIAVGSVTTGAAGSAAAVSNTGTSNAAVLTFTIPRGDAGTNGAAATVTVGTVTTGAAGSAASVSNAGTSTAAILNFTIPRGDTGGGGSGSGDALTTNPLSQFAATTSAQLRGVISDETGTGLLYFQGGALATPSSANLINATGLPLSTGISGLGTGIAAALAINAGAAGAPVLLGGAGGTPSSLTLTNATGLPFGAGITSKPTTLAGYGITDAVGSSDSRLSDPRTPTAHTQAASTISDSTTVGRALLTAVDAAAQRTSLGLGTAATTAASDYATAAQGTKADSALQAAALTPYRTSTAQDTIDASKAPATGISPSAITGTAVITTDSRLSDSREWSAATATQAEAEAGTSTSRFAFTPTRVFQAIAAWWAASAFKTKLDGIATGATANFADATLLARANHTGTQAPATIAVAATARLLGRASAGAGAAEEITLGTNLSLSGTILNAAGGSSSSTSNVYTVGSWIATADGASNISSVPTFGPSIMYLMPFKLRRSITANGLAARVVTAVASSKTELAIYANVNGEPIGAPLVTGLNLDSGIAGNIFATFADMNFSGETVYWGAANSNGAVALQQLSGATATLQAASLVGAPTLAATTGTSGGGPWRQRTQAFGTWPTLAAGDTAYSIQNPRGGLLYLQVAALL